MNVYFISGLGADRRAFQKIRLSEKFHIYHIDWIDPLPSESFKDYVVRLSKQVDTSQPFSLVGLSFGGLVAIEMADIIHPEKLVIISSISESSQLPLHLRLTGRLQLHRLVPAFLYKKPPHFISFFFGAKSQSDRKLLYQIFEDSNATFLKWAVDKLLNWKRKQRPDNLYHIHGSTDKLLPARRLNADVVIPHAGHLMILTHAREVSRLLEEKLNE